MYKDLSLYDIDFRQLYMTIKNLLRSNLDNCIVNLMFAQLGYVYVEVEITCYAIWDFFITDQKHFLWNTPSKVHHHKLKYLCASKDLKMPNLSFFE